MRERAASRRARSCRSPPSARPGKHARRSATSELEVRALGAERDRAASTSRCSRPAATISTRVGAALRRDAGCVVVDNSSAWRMEPNVPLVVAEVNPRRARPPRGHRRQPELLDHADGDGAEADPRRGRDRAGRSSPPTSRPPAPASGRSRSCATRRTRCSHGQEHPAVGLSAPDRLQRPAAGRDLQGRRRLHDRGAQDDGRDAQDPRRRLASRSPRPACACRSTARTPSRSTCRPREDLSPERCREVLARSPAWSVVDDPAAGRYPMPIDAAGRDDVLVGRIRRDPSHERCLNMWVVVGQPAQGRRHQRRAARRAAASSAAWSARARPSRARAPGFPLLPGPGKALHAMPAGRSGSSRRAPPQSALPPALSPAPRAAAAATRPDPGGSSRIAHGNSLNDFVK